MTNLNDTIRCALNTSKTFEKKHPQVVKWFTSDYFHEMMVVRGGKLSLRATYRAGAEWKFRPCLGLPFQDNVGVVDIEDIREYLLLQGFNVQVEEGFEESTYINISVNFE